MEGKKNGSHMIQSRMPVPEIVLHQFMCWLISIEKLICIPLDDVNCLIIYTVSVMQTEPSLKYLPQVW